MCSRRVYVPGKGPLWRLTSCHTSRTGTSVRGQCFRVSCSNGAMAFVSSKGGGPLLARYRDRRSE